MSNEYNIAIEKVRNQLKGFQTNTVRFVVKKLIKANGMHKVLIADEVGLGKTIVAKGVITELIDKNESGKPLHVVYICSNQVLANANLRKLNPFGSSTKSLSRLSFLAYEPEEFHNEHIRLSSLTPSTSFKLTNSAGTKQERGIIFMLLYHYPFFRNRKLTLTKLLKGNKQINYNGWKQRIRDHIAGRKKPIRNGLAQKYKVALENIDFDPLQCPETNELFKGKFDGSLLAALKKILDLKRDDSHQSFAPYWFEIIKLLRTILTEVCIQYLEADLFILDEFQRFKQLLDTENESEAGKIAKKILQNEEAKVILLSATPFKPYTTNIEEMLGENHYSELERLVKFLGGRNGNRLWKEFQGHQQAFFKILHEPQQAFENLNSSITTKEQLQKTFHKFMSRNERLNVAAINDNMTETMPLDKVDVSKGDIENFIVLDKLVQEVSNVQTRTRRNFGSTVEFSKSAPYSLSYLYGYSLHDTLFSVNKEPSIKNLLRQSRQAFLNVSAVNNYKAVGYHKGEPSYPNPKFRVLAEECFKDNAELMLWVPPTKPYYQPSGVYKDKEDFSKILIFSSWVMVPRAISTLMTYEAERRTIAKENINKLQEREERQYFHSPRRPRPLINFARNAKRELANMTNVCLLYPSRSLIQDGQLMDKLDRYNLSAREIVKRVELQIRNQFEEFNIQEKYTNGITADRSWYWLAPALLDAMSDNYDDTIESLISNSRGSEREHFKQLNSTLNDVQCGSVKMGAFPKLLFRTLSVMALASPANAALYALNKVYPKEEWSLKIKQANSIANDFRSLFNRPESIAAVRLSIKDKNDYWQQVLYYGLSGNITAMLEEYFYLLKDCENVSMYNERHNEYDIKDNLHDILGVVPSSIQVEMSNGTKYDKKKMRCHYAMSFGESKGETTDGKSSRDINVRSVFNSPFRPFVLSSTSIGQEGLDFHYYCRKIMHWNLPHNAIDFEQREGRINRFKSFTIRKKIAEIIQDNQLLDKRKGQKKSTWEALFELAEEKYNDPSGMKPFWYLDEGETKIERFVPIHKLSKDAHKYEQMKKVLALYRLTFGQPRQEELIEAFRQSDLSKEQIEMLRNSLFLNLSTG